MSERRRPPKPGKYELVIPFWLDGELRRWAGWNGVPVPMAARMMVAHVLEQKQGSVSGLRRPESWYRLTQDGGQGASPGGGGRASGEGAAEPSPGD